jgi:adenosylmethionine-8-amino-7-oxononanoate aminotransferase
MCVGKALTGGTMTMAAVMTRESIAKAISEHGVFMHGPTFMGNPLACSVACASLELLSNSPWQERVAKLENLMRTGLEQCKGMPGVADVRVLGAIGVLEMESEINSAVLQPFFVDAGVWIRPFAKLIYIMPPFISSEEDVHKLTSAMCRAVRIAPEEKSWQ